MSPRLRQRRPTVKELADAIEGAYIQFGERLSMRFHGPPPRDDEPTDTEQFAAEVLRRLS